ncbi:TPA: biotin-dependent carboxyltransferase family protein [Staphylococcus aureus]|nr:biotin-dependent carboxyltransferase family protein [Staphylococcus aureus]HDF0930760.1 biotin-dependent carboxyltransferase family protein [Staphylococcus aureus]
MSIKILQPGLFSTVQDLGRIGYEHIGFSGAGAMDQFSFKVAQSLINNDGPAIEYTLIGPTIQFNTQNTFVITGGSINASLNNKTISMNSVILAEKGDILKIGAITKGARGYLTFGHSINVPSIAESYATHTRSSIGGFKGRKLLANDLITVKINNDFKENIGKTIHLQDDLLPENNIIHILQGPQFEAFSEEARAKIVNHPYLITEQSDRMGYRLEGDSVAPINQADIISEPVALGSVQVPNDGQPIILLNDKQTIGGYTKIATVCKFDLPKLAQMKPKDTIQFKWISFQEAVDKNREQMSLFNEILKSHQKTPIFDTSSLRHTSKKLSTILKGDL